MPAASESASARAALSALWRGVAMPDAALEHVVLSGNGAVLPSSFCVADAAQASLGAAALAAAELAVVRGQPRQRVRVDRTHALMESSCWFSIDGVVPEPWDALSGLYPCGEAVGRPGWLRVHANFAHHRDRALRVLGCPTGAATQRGAVTEALRHWRAIDFESAAADAGAAVAALRSHDEWQRHPQCEALGAAPVVRIDRLGAVAPPLALAALGDAQPPLAGLRVLDLTRILAGPVACRTLAAYGADVLLVNSPSLPNIDAIAETSRGKRSAHVDLRTESGLATMQTLLRDAHVFVQGYRPGALAPLGFGAEELARRRPGIVVASLSAYGSSGPWAGRRGFDSLVQTATGFNDDEARAAGAGKPQPMPLQILDYAAGYLLAFGVQSALRRQALEGGSWHVQVSLAGVGHWLRGLGRVEHAFTTRRPAIEPFLDSEPSGFGRLVGVRHCAEFERTPAQWRLPSMPPGSHRPEWAPGSPACVAHLFQC